MKRRFALIAVVIAALVIPQSNTRPVLFVEQALYPSLEVIASPPVSYLDTPTSYTISLLGVTDTGMLTILVPRHVQNTRYEVVGGVSQCLERPYNGGIAIVCFDAANGLVMRVRGVLALGPSPLFVTAVFSGTTVITGTTTQYLRGVNQAYTPLLLN